MVQFLREIRFHLGQLTPNIIKIVLGVAQLNRHFNLSLGMYEIKYCYNLTQSEGKWKLKARVNSPYLVEGLSTSYKGMYDNIAVINSVVELDL